MSQTEIRFQIYTLSPRIVERKLMAAPFTYVTIDRVTWKARKATDKFLLQMMVEDIDITQPPLRWSDSRLLWQNQFEAPEGDDGVREGSAGVKLSIPVTDQSVRWYLFALGATNVSVDVRVDTAAS